MPRADTSRVVVLSRMRSNRDALWVFNERRMDSVGAVYTEPAISSTSGGVQGGMISKILMYRNGARHVTNTHGRHVPRRCWLAGKGAVESRRHAPPRFELGLTHLRVLEQSSGEPASFGWRPPQPAGRREPADEPAAERSEPAKPRLASL